MLPASVDFRDKMNIHFTLLPEAVGISDAGSKQAVLERLADQFAAIYAIDRALLLERLKAREELGSTGFGRGVAMPHARIPGVSRPVAAFLRMAAPVNFDSTDGMPVDFVFALISPEQAGAAHLQALAAISRMMRDDRMCERLAKATSPEELYGILSNVTDRNAA
jgi:nitrogen PTS system EIIA component